MKSRRKQLDLFESPNPEADLRSRGFSFLMGCDEVGRGPLAGPVVAAAVMLPHPHDLEGLTDSKILSESEREALLPQILDIALAWGVSFISPERIDAINILQASLEAMAQAASMAETMHTADYLIIDGNHTLHTDRPQQAVIKGDRLCPSISAASVLAKVCRDRYMAWLDRLYPGYGLAKNKGYPTPPHRKAVAELGPSPCHRKTFKGVKEYVAG